MLLQPTLLLAKHLLHGCESLICKRASSLNAVALLHGVHEHARCAWGWPAGTESPACGQAVFGLERLVDRTIARRVPKVAYGTSFALRFANNVVGGENFIDMARWAGIQ